MRTLDDLRAAVAKHAALEARLRTAPTSGRHWHAEDRAVVEAARALVAATVSAPRADGEEVMCFLTLEEWEAVKAARRQRDEGRPMTKPKPKAGAVGRVREVVAEWWEVRRSYAERPQFWSWREDHTGNLTWHDQPEHAVHFDEKIDARVVADSMPESRLVHVTRYRRGRRAKGAK